MSSLDEVSIRGTDLGPASGEHAEVRRFGPGLPRGLGHEERLLRSWEEKPHLPVSQSFQYGPWFYWHDKQEKSVIWDYESRPGTPVAEKGDFDPQLMVESTSIGHQLANREDWGVGGHSSPQSCSAEPSDVCRDPDTGPSKRAMRALSGMEAAGVLSKSWPGPKPAQEKKPLWDASKVIVGRTLPPWGQSLKSAPVEPVTFPPNSGVTPLLEAGKCSVLPSESKQCKSRGRGMKAWGRRTKESEQVTRQESDASRDGSLQPQFIIQRAEQPRTYIHRGEMSRGDPNTRVSQVPVQSQRMAMNQRIIRSRAQGPSGDQEPQMCPPIRAGERKIMAAPGCHQCLILLKEIEELREQLAFMEDIQA